MNLKGFEKLIKKINKIENTTEGNGMMAYFISEINDTELSKKSLLNNKIKYLLENLYEIIMNEINPLNHFICGSSNSGEVESEYKEGEEGEEEECEDGIFNRSEMSSSGIEIEMSNEKKNNSNERLDDGMNEDV